MRETRFDHDWEMVILAQSDVTTMNGTVNWVVRHRAV
jgi:hypothetical protein